MYKCNGRGKEKVKCIVGPPRVEGGVEGVCFLPCTVELETCHGMSSGQNPTTVSSGSLSPLLQRGCDLAFASCGAIKTTGCQGLDPDRALVIPPIVPDDLPFQSADDYRVLTLRFMMELLSSLRLPLSPLSLLKSFSSEGSRPAVTVKVGRTATCQSVCESIAAELDVAEARVVLRDNTRGEAAYQVSVALSSIVLFSDVRIKPQPSETNTTGTSTARQSTCAPGLSDF